VLESFGLTHPGQLLKLAGAASGGADAQALIVDGQVTVNGKPELRRGRALRPGDVDSKRSSRR
jgi:ribosome-associated protein